MKQNRFAHKSAEIRVSYLILPDAAGFAALAGSFYSCFLKRVDTQARIDMEQLQAAAG